ncbi:MAG: GumC family protein, partial [Elusimicrobiota bacterium]
MSQEYTIYDYWRILRRRKWFIIFSVIIVLGAAHFFSLRKDPVYKASTVCEVTAQSVAGVGGTYQWYSAGMMETEIRVAKSRKVVERALEMKGEITEETPLNKIDELVSSVLKQIKVTQEGNTNLLKIEVSSHEPDKAANLANTIAEAYIEVSQWQKKQTSRERREFMSSQLEYISEALRSSEEALIDYMDTGDLSKVKSSFTDRLESLKLDLQSLKSQYTDQHPKVLETQERIEELQSSLSAISEERLVQQRLERDIKVNEELYFMLSKQYREMLVADAGEPPKVRVINPAIEPQSPESPGTAVGYGMGSIVGLIFGIILAFFKEQLDTSIGTIEEIEEFLKLPVLGIIPYFTPEKDVGTAIDELKEKASGSKKHSSRLVIAHKPKSSVSEAFRTMETNVDFTSTGIEDKTLLFTSTTMQEGKSVVVSNFALSAAQAHKKVLLVEADFRAPMLHNMFGVPRN